MNQNYDTIVIGAGLAGLSVGAILSAREGKRVAVLEKEDYLGGRLVSFEGRGDRLLLHGDPLDARALGRVLASVYAWVERAEPDLETMLSKGLLDGFSFEAGGHATFWGKKGRVACLLDYLGTPVDLPGNEGFAVIDPERFELFPMEPRGSYGWMSEESGRTAKGLLREMATATPEVLGEWDALSFGEWLNQRTRDRAVYEFLAALASIHMVMGEPDMIPAGDFIRFMRAAVAIGMNLISGSTGIVPKPGFVRIAERIAEKIRESDGTILTGHQISEISFSGDRVSGVRVRSAAGEQTFTAEQVVCTVPVRKIWGFLPRERFAPAFVELVESDFFSVGMLTGYVGLGDNILAEAGINPKSWLLAPAVIKAEEGYIGDVDIISIMPSSFAPTLAPEGKHTLAFSIALTEGELRDGAKVKRVIDQARDIFHRTFPGMEAATLWELWTCSDKGFGDWPPPGQSRPDTTQPGMEGLYFAGDGYGAATWGSGMDAAVYSALLCVDAMTGKGYSEQVLPAYHRDLVGAGV
jgi:phytoene dehydrogenase-like protein